MDETCVAPDEIQPGDLMAFVDGTAGEAVADHVRRCPACARQAEELAAMQFGLTAGFYRFSCPSTEQLIAYGQRELRGQANLLVAQHLRRCPHCARALATLVREEQPGLGERLRASFRAVEAALLPLPLRSVELRRHPLAAHTPPRVYRGGDIEVLIRQEPALSQPGHFDLRGLIVGRDRAPEETVCDAGAELYCGDRLIAIEPLTPRFQFTFDALPARVYDVCLVWPGQEIWLRDLQVG